MDDSTHEQRSLIRVGLVVLSVLLGLLFCLILSGCKTQYIEVEKPIVVEHTTTQHHTDIVRDTITMRDSVYHYVHGDTVIIERYHHFADVSKKVVTDTIRDTVPQIVETTKVVTKEVEKPLPWHTKGLATLGAIALIGLFISVVFKLIK